MQVPVLKTPRLTLRAHRLEDFGAFKEVWRQPEVIKHTIGTPSTEQQSWMRLMNYLGHWELLSFGYWAIEESRTGNYIGDIGFADFKRELDPSIQGIPESGWILSRDVHGKGYAKEALTAILEWGDLHLPSSKTVCLINPENTRSIDLAEKNGYTKKQETVFNGKPTILFERLKN